MDLCPLSGVKRTSQTTARLQGAAFRWPLSVMVYAATGAGVEAEEIAETNLHRIQGSALRWPFSSGEKVRALTVA